MTIKKLGEIKQELKRFEQKLEAATQRAIQNDTNYNWDGMSHRAPILLSERDCTNTKEAGALKRAALDLKQILSNL